MFPVGFIYDSKIETNIQFSRNASCHDIIIIIIIIVIIINIIIIIIISPSPYMGKDHRLGVSSSS